MSKLLIAHFNCSSETILPQFPLFSFQLLSIFRVYPRIIFPSVIHSLTERLLCIMFSRPNLISSSYNFYIFSVAEEGWVHMRLIKSPLFFIFLISNTMFIVLRTLRSSSSTLFPRSSVVCLYARSSSPFKRDKLACNNDHQKCSFEIGSQHMLLFY